MAAHRFSWLIHFGAPPDEMRVCHRCDVPTCVNPAHLFLGTDKDNIADAVAKGRIDFRGESNPFGSRLTSAEIAKIRASYPSKTLKRLSESYGVSIATIHRIVRRSNWKHVA